MQESWTRKRLAQESKSAVQVSSASWLVQVSWACVTGIRLSTHCDNSSRVKALIFCLGLLHSFISSPRPSDDLQDFTYHHSISYHGPKRQNRLKVGTDKPKLKVKMHSISARWWCTEKTSYIVQFRFQRTIAYAERTMCYRPSVCPSVTRVDQSKTQLSPPSSPIFLVFAV